MRFILDIPLLDHGRGRGNRFRHACIIIGRFWFIPSKCMTDIQNDRNEWFSPEKFMPERFDTSSPYYKRPDGKKRNPLSFNPFFGGKRICLGKTFAEIIAKFVVPALLSRFTFDLVDQDYITGAKEKPKVNLGMDDDPIVLMKLSRVNLKKYQ